MTQTPQETTTPKSLYTPVVSSLLTDDSILESLYRPHENRTLFCVWGGDTCTYHAELEDRGLRLVPFRPTNNLLTNNVVLLPSEPTEYNTESHLLEEIQAFIHRYVDISPLFEKISAYYVLLSWVYDAFPELPYLRVRGDYGSGKTRFLLIVGSVCYKPMFASGASTVSPIFRILDSVHGTLIIDEADFRLSDEKSEIVKILNNGNAKGFPVLRSEVQGKEYNPRAYHVFGPKLVATRGFFRDRALESRCITEEMGHRSLRDDVPISLPDSYQEEALQLRNKLLLFRFRNLSRQRTGQTPVDRTIEPRLNQIFGPLLSIIEDKNARKDIRELARTYNRELISDRGMDIEAQVLEIIQAMREAHQRLSIRDITSWFRDRHEDDYERKITPKWIGGVIRKRLQLKTARGNDGSYEILSSEKPKLDLLLQRYGLAAPREADQTAESLELPFGAGRKMT